jgi:hypothetical protein
MTSPSREQFWFEQEDGARRKAPEPIAGFTTEPRESVSRGEHNVMLWVFFGSHDQFQALGRERDEHEDPRPGWIRQQ